MILLPVLVSMDCKTFVLDWLLLLFPNSLRDPTGYPSLSRHITTNDPSENWTVACPYSRWYEEILDYEILNEMMRNVKM